MARGGRADARETGGAGPERDPVLAGLAGAQALLAALREDPRAPLAQAVVGAGGSGKSALISVLVRAARRRGLATRRVRRGDTVPFPADEDVLLLVDDAHTLDEATLAELTDVAEDPEARLVVAARPWPCPRALSTLWLALGRTRAPLSLEPLTVAGTEERMTAVLGSRCPPSLVTTVARLSGGSPAVVDRLAAQIRDAGVRSAPLAAEGSAEIPAGVLDLLRHEVGGLDDATRRLLLALAVGAPRVPAALADVLGVDRTTLDELVDRARASGLLLPTGPTGPTGLTDVTDELGAPAERVAPLARRTLLRLGAAAERLDLQRRVAEHALARGASVLAPARRLLGSGLRGDGLARVFTAAGDEALATAPHLASALYADAVAAGAAPDSVVLPRAEASALAGDLDVALRLADPLVASPDDAERARAVVVVATVMAHRGMGRTATTLLADVPRLRPWAVPGLVATGALDRAREAHGSAGEVAAATSTALRSAIGLLGQGVLASVGPEGSAAPSALSDLTRAATLVESVGAGALLPESPAALAALVALHTGEPDLADSVLRRAHDTTPGGPALAPRHHLLRAWGALQRGDVGGVREHVTAARSARPVLEPRDELPAAALEVGIARRTGDSAALRAAWSRAREALVRHPVDLFALLPLGELAVGAARLGEQATVRAAWDDAEALLSALGNPPLWSAAVRWYGLAAAITGEDVPAAERHLAALDEHDGVFPLASALAAAARQWLAALSGEVDAVAVDAAARGLHRLGWAWDGARLAGEAAIRTRDRRAMAALLACARSLTDAGRTAPDGTDAAHPGIPTSGLVREPGEVTLSEREREVARLVLAGLTHKQIGARLFISSKTVEHHVARMRQRLESGSRGELFAQLRELVGDPPAGSR